MKRISNTKIALFALSLVPPESFSLQLPIHPQNRHHHHHHHYPLTTTKPSSSSRNLASVTSIAPSPSSTVVETPIAAATVTASSTIHQQQRRTLPRLSEPEIWKLALAGSLATLLSDVSMHPLDCIKTLQQTEEGIGLSMIAAAHFIYHTMGGLTGFSRGFLTWGVCDALGGALKFSTYEGLKRQIQQELASRTPEENNDQSVDATSDGEPSLRNTIIFALAAVSFVASSVITVPGELLKQHLQMGHYPGCFEALWNIVDTQGITGLYRGYDGVLLRDTPYTALELGLYDVFKNLYLQQRKQRQRQSRYSDSEESDTGECTLQISEQTLIAGLTGGVAGLFTTPFDTVKTKATLDFVGCSFWDSAMLTIQDHGPEALFCGAAARVAWLIPVTAIYLPTYDLIKTKVQEHHHQTIQSSKVDAMDSQR